MIEHDQTHADVVDSYLRDILLHNFSDDTDIDPIDIVPEDVWPCVMTSIVSLLQATLELLADLADRTVEEEVDTWLTDES